MVDPKRAKYDANTDLKADPVVQTAGANHHQEENLTKIAMPSSSQVFRSNLNRVFQQNRSEAELHQIEYKQQQKRR